MTFLYIIEENSLAAYYFCGNHNFDIFNVHLLNKSINFLKKKKFWPQTFEQ